MLLLLAWSIVLFFFMSPKWGILNIDSSVAFCRAESRLPHTAVSPAPQATEEKQLLGLIWSFQAGVITTYGFVASLRMFFYNKVSASSSVFWDKLPSHSSLDDYDWQTRVLLGFIYWLKQAELFQFRSYPLVFLQERAEYHLISLKETPGSASIRFLVSNCL